MEDEVASLPLSALREPRTLLRLVDTESLEFFELRDSLKRYGFLHSISVRPAVSEPDRYEIIDGVCRYTAAKELGLRLIPCIIKHHVTDDDLLALQVQGNAVGIDTKPTEYALHLRRILSRHPDMTLAELGCLISKSSAWVSDILGLTKLDRETQQAVDRGEMPLKNAYMLAKLPGAWKRQYLHEACTMSVRKFHELAASLIKQFTESVRQGKLDEFFADRFVANPHLRDLREISTECDQKLAGPLVILTEGCQTPLEGFYAALRWVTHMDEKGIREQEAAHQSRQRMRPINDTLNLAPESCDT